MSLALFLSLSIAQSFRRFHAKQARRSSKRTSLGLEHTHTQTHRHSLVHSRARAVTPRGLFYVQQYICTFISVSSLMLGVLINITSSRVWPARAIHSRTCSRKNARSAFPRARSCAPGRLEKSVRTGAVFRFSWPLFLVFFFLSFPPVSSL